jgi:hypothetical protein
MLRQNLAAILVINIFCFVVTPAFAQATKPVTRTSAILVDTDDSCRLSVDGDDKGVINPDQTTKIKVEPGEHILKCVIEKVPDLNWRKVVEAKSAEQAAALISLKALHMQYDQAMQQAEQQKARAAAAEQQRKIDEAEFPAKLAELLRGTWTHEEQYLDGDGDAWRVYNVLEFLSINSGIVAAHLTENHASDDFRSSSTYSISLKIIPPDMLIEEDGGTVLLEWRDNSHSKQMVVVPNEKRPGGGPHYLKLRISDAHHILVTEQRDLNGKAVPYLFNKE